MPFQKVQQSHFRRISNNYNTWINPVFEIILLYTHTENIRQLYRNIHTLLNKDRAIKDENINFQKTDLI